ncbi:MAG: hypothetical protein ACREDR_24890 [Blastocatellia bacterium]
MAYEVYLYTLPRISGDGKSIPGAETKKQEFTSVDDARAFAGEQKASFDRVVLMETGEEGQKLVERYMDGKPA